MVAVINRLNNEHWTLERKTRSLWVLLALVFHSLSCLLDSQTAHAVSRRLTLGVSSRLFLFRLQVRKLKKPVEGRYPSIQGVWDIDAPLHTIDMHVEHHG